MGRPLKIAKAQAVLTITDTAAATDTVTVSQDLLDPASAAYGVIAGMPFVTASSTGGMTAGTTYWILEVTGNSTFTVSETQLSANPTYTPLALSDTSSTTVATSVGVVDSGFNNPEGVANTYGVVGGNTAIYGNQVLCRVAIGVSGTGTIFSSTGSALVFGDANTNFDGDFVAGTNITVAVPNINGISTNYTSIGFVSSVGNTDVAVANTVVSGNIIGVSSGDATNLIVDRPIQFLANIGTLVANTTYFVKAVANNDAFTVSASLGGPEVQMTANTSATTGRQQVAYLAGPAALANATANSYIYSKDEAGFILRQKGKQKYLVQGATTGLVAQCLTANLANAALVPNSMNILATYANSATQYVQSLSDIDSELFTATSGPIASGNIVLANADPVYATFNSAVTANSANGLIYELVQIPSA